MSRATRYRSLATTPLERLVRLLAEIEVSRYTKQRDELLRAQQQKQEAEYESSDLRTL